MGCKLKPVVPTRAVDVRRSIIEQGMARVGIHSNEQLGYYLGISGMSVGNMLRGKTKLTISRCQQLLKILHLTDEEYHRLTRV